MITAAITDVVFENKSVYLSGNSFVRCKFRSCTLIIKDLPMLGLFQDCEMENCVWQIDVTISDRTLWRKFMDNLAPTIMDVLPVETTPH